MLYTIIIPKPQTDECVRATQSQHKAAHTAQSHIPILPVAVIYLACVPVLRNKNKNDKLTFSF